MKVRMSKTALVNLYRALEKHLPRKQSDLPADIRLTGDPDGLISATAFSEKSGIVITCRDGEVIEAGSILFNGIILGQTLVNLPAGDIEMEGLENRGKLTASDISIGFRLSDSKAYPFPPPQANGRPMFTVGSKMLHDMFRKGSTSSTRGDEYPKYLGACLVHADDGRIRVASTDGRRLSVASGECESHEAFGHILIDTEAAHRLVYFLKRYPDGPMRATSFDRWVCFAGESFQVWTARREGTFPNYLKILPQGPSKTMLTVNARELRNALELARIFAHSCWLGLCTFGYLEEGRLDIHTPRNCDWTGRMSISATGSGEKGQTGFDCTFMLDALKCVDAETVDIRLNGEAEAAFLDTEGFLYMIMPVQLTEDDRINLDAVREGAWR